MSVVPQTVRTRFYHCISAVQSFDVAIRKWLTWFHDPTQALIHHEVVATTLSNAISEIESVSSFYTEYQPHD